MNVNITNVEIKLLEGVELPIYGTEGSAGFDFVAHSFKKLYDKDGEIPLVKLGASISKGYIILRPFQRILIGSGIFMQIPEGHELQIRSRSGNALKKGLIVANQPGTIDSDYRNEISIILVNNNNGNCVINIGDRVAQGVLTTYEKANFKIVTELTTTSRAGGFGSTDARNTILMKEYGIAPIPDQQKFL